jgi:Protein phosphatase 2C
MSQWDRHRRDEDDWWKQLYGPQRPDPEPTPDADSVDEHFADVRTVFDDPAAPRPPAGGTAPGAGQGRGTGPRDPRVPAEPGAYGPAAPGAGDGPAAPGGGFGEFPPDDGTDEDDEPDGTPPGGVGEPWGDAEAWFGAPPQQSPSQQGPPQQGPPQPTLRLRTISRPPGPGTSDPETPGPGTPGPGTPDQGAPGQVTPGQAPSQATPDQPAPGQPGPGQPAPGQVAPAQGAPTQGPPAQGAGPGPTATGTPAAQDPPAPLEFTGSGADSAMSEPAGFDVREPAPAAPEHVGDRPPTYQPEPTAWPFADPERMDALTPDTVLDGAAYGPLTLRAVSQRGDSARYRGQPRRDALLTARFGEGEDVLLFAAVASGARTGEESYLAAQTACRWIGSAVGRHGASLLEDIRAARRGSLKSGLHRLTGRCLGQLKLRAGELGLEPADWSASLRCLLLPADPNCRTRVYFGVGDGGLFRLREGQWQDLDPVRDYPPQAVPGSEDEPPPAPPFRFRASVGRPGDVLFLCTEGMASPLLGSAELAALLASRWSGAAPGLATYLRDSQIRVKGFAEDRTAVGIWET